MARIDANTAGSQNVVAFLDMIAHSEIGPKLLATSDDGYNVIVGGELFKGYGDHPRVLVALGRLGIKSTAAGRYQLLSKYYDAYKAKLHLPDFSPLSQDLIAIQQLRETRALPLILDGNLAGAINRCANIWASLPGAGYGQHENKLSDLQLVYLQAGGALA
jgi:muramidase (phage lysozyme)